MKKKKVDIDTSHLTEEQQKELYEALRGGELSGCVRDVSLKGRLKQFVRRVFG